MLARFLFCLLLISISLNGGAQKHKYVSFELAGSGGLGSVNYEQAVLDNEKFDLHFRAGFSFAPIDKNNGTALIFPVMLHGLLFEGPHKLDVGLGLTFTVTTRGSLYSLMPFSCGYRFEPTDKRYYLRASYTPIISYLFEFQWQHWGGLTYGYRITK